MGQERWPRRTKEHDRDLYEVLGAQPRDSAETLKTQFNKLAKKHHPDVLSGSTTRFRQILYAFRILSDPKSRRQYDEEREAPPHRSSASHPPSSATQRSEDMQKRATDPPFYSRAGFRSYYVEGISFPRLKAFSFKNRLSFRYFGAAQLLGLAALGLLLHAVKPRSFKVCSRILPDTRDQRIQPSTLRKDA